jgi:hypothetical protein
VLSKRKLKPSKKIYDTWTQVKFPFRLLRVAVCVLFFAAALTGCAALQRQTPEDRKAAAAARELLSRLAATNQSLQDFKGIGRIQLEAGNATATNERLVWAASAPEKLSVAVLASGLPVLKFASDGRHLYFIDMRNARGSFHKIRSSDPQLDRLISIPVRSSDIVLLLAGRLPVREHGRVRLAIADTGRRVLTLEQWWQVVEKIYVDAERDEVQMVEFFDGQGRLAYRANLIDRQTAGTYRVPRKIEITGSSGAWLRLRIERLFPDADIQPEVFILKPPDRHGSAAAR